MDPFDYVDPQVAPFSKAEAIGKNMLALITDSSGTGGYSGIADHAVISESYHTFSIRRLMVPYLPQNQIYALMNKLNSATVQIGDQYFPPGTMRVEAPELELKLTPDEQQYYDITLIFSCRKHFTSINVPSTTLSGKFKADWATWNDFYAQPAASRSDHRPSDFGRGLRHVQVRLDGRVLPALRNLPTALPERQPDRLSAPTKFRRFPEGKHHGPVFGGHGLSAIYESHPIHGQLTMKAPTFASGFGDSLATSSSPPVTPQFYAQLGNYHDNTYGSGSGQVTVRQWEWRAVARILDPTTQQFFAWQPIYQPTSADNSGHKGVQSDQTSSSNPNITINYPAIENNNYANIPSGSIVYLTEGGMFNLQSSSSSSYAIPATQEYLFDYSLQQPGIVQGQIQVSCYSGDTSATVQIVQQDGSMSKNVQALDPLGLSGGVYSKCVCFANLTPGQNQQYPWILFGIQHFDVPMVEQVNFNPYTGSFTEDLILINTSGPSIQPSSTWPVSAGLATPWATTVDSGTDLQRDGTSVTSPTVSGTYGANTVTATVSKSSGSATPTGYILFTAGGIPVGVSGAITSAGVGTLSLTEGQWLNQLPDPTLAGYIQAFYNGDSSYQQSSSSTASYALTAAATTTSLTANQNNQAYGTNILWTITIALPSGNNGVVQGTVVLKDGSTTLATLTVPATSSSAIVTFQSALLTAGTHALSAVFTPTYTSQMSGSTGNLSQVVTKAALTVTANPQVITYGQPAPVYTSTLTGWQNGEGLYVLSGTFAYSCPTPAAGMIAPQTISVSQGSTTAANYFFTFVSGTLTINQAQLNIDAQNVTVPVGSGQPAYPVSVSGIQFGDNITALGRIAAGPPNMKVVGSCRSRPSCRCQNINCYMVNTTSGVLSVQ